MMKYVIAVAALVALAHAQMAPEALKTAASKQAAAELERGKNVPRRTFDVKSLPNAGPAKDSWVSFVSKKGNAKEGKVTNGSRVAMVASVTPFPHVRVSRFAKDGDSLDAFWHRVSLLAIVEYEEMDSVDGLDYNSASNSSDRVIRVIPLFTKAVSKRVLDLEASDWKGELVSTTEGDDTTYKWTKRACNLKPSPECLQIEAIVTTTAKTVETKSGVKTFTRPTGVELILTIENIQWTGAVGTDFTKRRIAIIGFIGGNSLKKEAAEAETEAKDTDVVEGTDSVKVDAAPGARGGRLRWAKQASCNSVVGNVVRSKLDASDAITKLRAKIAERGIAVGSAGNFDSVQSATEENDAGDKSDNSKENRHFVSWSFICPPSTGSAATTIIWDPAIDAEDEAGTVTGSGSALLPSVTILLFLFAFLL